MCISKFDLRIVLEMTAPIHFSLYPSEEAAIQQQLVFAQSFYFSSSQHPS